jgi:hypothetical protein
MRLRATSVSSMLFLDDVGITVVQDHRSTWRFGDLHRGFRSVAIHITDEDRQRALLLASTGGEGQLCTLADNNYPLF